MGWHLSCNIAALNPVIVGAYPQGFAQTAQEFPFNCADNRIHAGWHASPARLASMIRAVLQPHP
ncbi:hypothetical protein COO20_22125 [Thalassospira marina]|uniref:Uncharacterized protein n=1 Tax=Thalassospira marina TaxID=2048283 RepID=A0A2N3KGQ0_9PROT|nr:hypothetical protein COO20_22125 [Thalassospira marina]